MSSMVGPEALVAKAREAMANAYVPYSGYHVGAALVGKSGRIYTGCNVENASYGATICAERTAVVKAVSEGEREFVALAVISDGPDYASPCGICRQVLAEFGDFDVILATNKGDFTVKRVSDLLPGAFGLAHLKAAKSGSSGAR